MKKIAQLFRFALSGIPGAVVMGAVFIGLTEWGDMPYWHSLIIARIVNTVINFCIQHLWLYPGRYYHWGQLIATYTLVSALLIAVNTLLLRLIVEVAGMHYIIAQALLIFPLTYLAEKLVRRTFKQKRRLY